jgi:hypothetical protein
MFEDAVKELQDQNFLNRYVQDRFMPSVSLQLVRMESTTLCNSLIGHAIEVAVPLMVRVHLSFDKNLF